jgi:DNA polymerase III subunit epsilon
MPSFVAIDFETADPGGDSACAIGLVRVEGTRIVGRLSRLIRPPRRQFHFTWVHGIAWPDVEREPEFAELWPEIQEFIRGADFLAAHNAGFDRGVMQACCERARIEPPQLPYLCTVRLAREAWNVRPTKLPDVCRYLVIPLRHHDAASDAEACARIVIAAIEEGRRVP